MRDNWLSNRIFKPYDDLVDHCCEAWNKLIDQPWRIISINSRTHGILTWIKSDLIYCRLHGYQLAAAEQRATAAEERANKAETSVRRLEDELQTQKMGARPRQVPTAA
jgi:hypothetical protein